MQYVTVDPYSTQGFSPITTAFSTFTENSRPKLRVAPFCRTFCCLPGSTIELYKCYIHFFSPSDLTLGCMLLIRSEADRMYLETLLASLNLFLWNIRSRHFSSSHVSHNVPLFRKLFMGYFTVFLFCWQYKSHKARPHLRLWKAGRDPPIECQSGMLFELTHANGSCNIISMPERPETLCCTYYHVGPPCSN